MSDYTTLLSLLSTFVCVLIAYAIGVSTGRADERAQQSIEAFYHSSSRRCPLEETR